MTLPQPLRRNASLAEEGLRAIFAQRSFPLYHMMEYQLGWRDETGAPRDIPIGQTRLHANLCLLACQTMGGDPEKAIHAAVGIELMYQFTQVHADIQDGSQDRYNRPTVWWTWGPAQAINAGDGLHALARLSLMGSGEQGEVDETLRLLQTFDAASLRMFEGMHQDLAYQERVDIAPEAYLKTAREKVGALLGCALELGVIAAAGPSKAAQALRQFGENVAMAYQVQEDIQMLWGEPLSGKARGIDALNKKKGFPVLQALAKAPISQKRELGTLFFKRVLEPPDLEQVTAILDSLEARSGAEEVVRRLYDDAVSSLQDADLMPDGRDDLIEVARWLALRE